MEFHRPVMLNEVLDFLEVKTGGKYIDCTLGDGGHTIEILKLGGCVLGLDYSQESLDRAVSRIKDLGLSKNFVGRLANFKNLEKIANEAGFSQVDGVLFDLGYSSSQLDLDPSGLSFSKEGDLDMRLDKTLGVSAADLVNTLPEKELAKMFFDYGDERFARRFAHAIVKARELKKLTSTQDLVKVIVDAAPSGYENGRIHPATRVFQSLRIAVNDEIDNLNRSLPQAARLLLPRARMIVISFHSLEDGAVKRFGQAMQPVLKSLVAKPVVPSEAEVFDNVRARSAKMRVYEQVRNSR